MEIGTILNTKMAVAVVAGTPIHFDMQHAMAHELQQQHYPHPSYMNGRIKSEAGSERGISPHPSDAGRYTSQPPPPIQAYQTMPNALANGIRYTSPTPQMNSPIPMLHNSYVPNPPEHTYAQQAPQPEQQPTQVATRSGTGESGPPKAFACSTCGKGFARRSDLARHGEFLKCRVLTPVSNFDCRANPQWSPTARLRLPWMRQTIYSAVSFDRPPACPHG